MKEVSEQMSPYEDSDWTFAWNRLILQVLGLWIYPGQSQLCGILSHVHTTLIALSIFSFLILPQTMALIRVWGTPALIVDNIAFNLPVMAAELKLLVLWYKKNDVAHIFALIEKDWVTMRSSHERDMTLKYAVVSKILTIGGLVGSVATSTMYHIPIAWKTAIRTINNITDIPGALFSVQAVYAYDVTQSTAYRLTLLSQCVGTVFASLSYTGVDVLFSMFVMYLCGQLVILANKIETMASQRNHMKYCLKNNVERHCALIEYAAETEDIFSFLILALVILFAVIFCLESYTLLSIFSDSGEIPIAQVAFYIAFAIYFLFLMFVYSWVGETLVTCSESLHQAAYNCEWTSLTPKEFVQIMFILIRSERPLHITAGKFAPMTLSTFVTICKTSCGWLSVLRAMER